MTAHTQGVSGHRRRPPMDGTDVLSDAHIASPGQGEAAMSVRAKGPLPAGWEPSSAKRQNVLADVLDRYRQHRREGTLPRGGRGIFYDLRPRGFGRGIAYVKRGKDRKYWYERTWSGIR